MASSRLRAPYSGPDPAIVIGIDVGTTFSGVSYTLLTPGQIPLVESVTGFKGQEDQSSSTKVPSVLYYDLDGTLLACGSEGSDQFSDEDDDTCMKVEWFKLLLRPSSTSPDLRNAPRTHLPAGLTVVDVFSDFLRYLKGCAKEYILENHDNGGTLWAECGEKAIYILTHPNGWAGHQQGQMRSAAIKAGLVPDTDEGRQRIEFVTEGEASFHWCVDTGLASSSLFVGSQIIVADCGGGTIDVSSFRVTSLRPLRLEETHSAECRLAGSVFVTQAFRTKVQNRLRNSLYGEEESISIAVKDFDKRMKCIFRDSTPPVHISIGTRRDNDAGHNIKLGKLTLPGTFVAEAFEKSCTETAGAIRTFLKRNKSAQVFLVGGFAASPWLMNELKRRLVDTVQELKRADSHTAKAVAHGAIVYYLDHFISSRVAKHTYGVSLSWRFDPSDKEHVSRSKSAYTCTLSGEKLVDGGFESLIQKGKPIRDDAIYRTSLVKISKERKPEQFEISLDRYSGRLSKIAFYDMDEGTQFQSVCTFSADIPPAAFVSTSGTLGQYWEIPFDVVVTLGTAEIKCYVEWTEKGVKKKSLASSAWEDY